MFDQKWTGSCLFGGINSLPTTKPAIYEKNDYLLVKYKNFLFLLQILQP